MKQSSLAGFLKIKEQSNSQTVSSKPKEEIKPQSTTKDESNKKRSHVIDDEAEEDAQIHLLESSTRVKQDVCTQKTSSTQSKYDTGESIPFNTLVLSLLKVEGCKGENSKDVNKETLANVFKDLIINSPSDLARAYYFLLSKVGPEYKSPEFGIGTGILEKVVAKTTGKSEKQIKENMKDLGDLALVAMEGKKTLGTMEKFEGFVAKTAVKKDLTLKNVMDNFVTLANLKGKSSQEEKIKILVKLMFQANKEELKYIVRSLQKGLKIGASFKTIIAALARGIVKVGKGDMLVEKEIERAILISINQLSDEDIVFDHLITLIKEDEFTPDKLISLCNITPGTPVKPQLARPTNGVKVIFERFEGVPFTCEYKYDGFRGQIHHYSKDGVIKTEIFSRNMENMTESYPDLVEYVAQIHSNKTSSFIIDCEIVAFDKKNDKILPFQQLTTRARKNVNVSEITIHVCMFVFDIIYLNGKNICEETLEERRKILRENFTQSDRIQFAKSLTSDKLEEVEEFMNEAKTAGTEGLIIKALDKNSAYMPGQRNFNWLKLKKDYLETSIGDSLDLVPIGAQYGKGKRKGFYGSYLLACYNEDSEKYETVTMTGAGLKDEDLENIYNELSKCVIDGPRKDYVLGETKDVDVYFDAKIVWEVKTADLSLSPIYTAGESLTDEKRGISLRFPRFIRLRPDKKPEECTSSEEIHKMYLNQNLNQKPINLQEEEFYD